MRFIVIEDQKLKDLIEKKEKLANEVQEITKDITKLEEDRNKLVLKIKRYNDKALPLIKKYEKRDELGEFEDYSRLYLKDGEVRLEIFDAIEEYKTMYRQQKEQRAKNEQNATDTNGKSETTDK